MNLSFKVKVMDVSFWNKNDGSKSLNTGDGFKFLVNLKFSSAAKIRQLLLNDKV